MESGPIESVFTFSSASSWNIFRIKKAPPRIHKLIELSGNPSKENISGLEDATESSLVDRLIRIGRLGVCRNKKSDREFVSETRSLKESALEALVESRSRHHHSDGGLGCRARSKAGGAQKKTPRFVSELIFIGM